MSLHLQLVFKLKLLFYNLNARKQTEILWLVNGIHKGKSLVTSVEFKLQ